jgi:hypothetical protein
MLLEEVAILPSILGEFHLLKTNEGREILEIPFHVELIAQTLV